MWDIKIFIIAFLPVLIYVLIGGINGMWYGTYQMVTVKNIVYTILPFVLAFFMSVYYEKNSLWIVDAQFVSSCLMYVVPNFGMLYLGYTWESTYSFVFGLFSIYYAYRKKWLVFLCSVFLSYRADKRIAIFGVILVLGIMFLMWFFKYNKKLIITIWTTVVAFIYAYLGLIYSGKLESFCWVMNINTNGRVQMYTRMANQYKFSIKFTGRGIGIMENMLEHMKIDSFANLHNDLLKFYIELGFVGLFIYLTSYYIVFCVAEKNYEKSKVCFLMGISIYSMLLFATDNVSIYLMYLLPFFSTIFAVFMSKENICKRRNIDVKQTNQ